MKILIDEVQKIMKLVKRDGKEISNYSYKNTISDDFTFEDFKRNIDSFNNTLSQYDDFDSIKDLSDVIKVHNWE